MPSIVGPLKINSVGGGTVNFGDAFYIAPKSSAKTNSGSGSLNTGDFINTNNLVSSTNPFDSDLYDQIISRNA
ncbi:spore germination protein [Tenuibacillus multivorans]|uniref:Spore germination protein PF n=1 Tax=Tenuibacillus multivorans TaxID=237069 RepID=A0A1H0A1G0_9BACI|nr:spore germination protein [Tenuibacillus multivorans]GEL78352.1 putative spore germination protein GerPF [Tenuibacillus multivorans]SDN27124.1 spore germination protein PF [Tenuibacillus multivorans]